MRCNKRVLILANISLVLYRFRKELIERLLSEGYEIYVSCMSDEFGGKLRSMDITFIETTINRRSVNIFNDYVLYRKYHMMIKEINPDAILTYTVKPTIYGNIAARKFNIPVITTITGLGDTFLSNNIVSKIVKCLYRYSLKKTACIALQNDEDLQILQSANIITSQHTIRVPGSGINLQEYQPLPYPQGNIVNFIYIGRIMRSKGILQLIEATRKLKVKYKDAFTVTLLGFHEGDVRQEVEQAQREGLVEYAGFVTDVVEYMRDVHCVVFPSYYKEGMANVLLEAAASARPIITTNISGCREVVDHGVNGYICTPCDSDSLYERMNKFLQLSNENRVKMGKSSRCKVEDTFDRQIVVNTMMNAIRGLVRSEVYTK